MNKLPKKDNRIDELRQQLYSRDSEPQNTNRTKLKKRDINSEVKKTWDTKEDVKDTHATGHDRTHRTAGVEEIDNTNESTVDTSHRNSLGLFFRSMSLHMKIVFSAGAFFVGAVLVAITLMVVGGNTISGDNIAVSIDGPFTVGGGEELALQIAITNNNAVAIETATLIVEYPDGTQSVEESGEPFSLERLSLDRIRSGESVNVPLNARVFGEENEEQFIRASIEYRVSGSNATFFKEIDPYRYKISSSPVTLSIESVEQVAAGQEFELTITATSNAADELYDLMLELTYPDGFELQQVSQPPVSGENTWQIGSLAPEEKKEITITGVLIGSESESRTVRARLGVADTRTTRTLTSILSTASTEITIEQPFISVSIGGQSGGAADDDTIAITPGSVSSLAVVLENVLSDALYDLTVRVELSGNALRETNVTTNRGFYDSNTQTITWDQSSDRSLAEFPAGAERSLQFTLDPDPIGIRMPQINISASVHARRVRESNVAETLVGTDRADVRIASVLQMQSATLYSSGPFQDSGPIPPQVGEETSYTLQLQVRNGSNDIADASVTASLPSYVMFDRESVGDGELTYNASNRSLTWNIGDVEAGAVRTMYLGVSMVPSASQINSTPQLLGEQRFTATDRFTGTRRTRTAPALTTILVESPDTSGRVQR